ncbi:MULTISPECIES: MAPEG family protein [Rhodopseudomonas]|uniref:Membrane protein n=1 Tax=Rhodopseudomonas palustris TaxID=1076 RepID=A0A0D7EZD9_RHOPL|nr:MULTISPECIES: MAPEG family protein [Rhodopseudomonas]KIZ46204.1 membrane protein [Rhodopseudomonas palustris]MDF3811615.1 MAPEG family protein [Rhodopseudomonas sp. BAL398]WOK16380.1 MAPEG family protein [Rhodopseudomonas sp. BAL398]
MPPLPTEITVLGWSVVLLIGQIFLASVPVTLELGGQYQAGPRDAGKVAHGKFAGRAGRAFRNLLETYPVFVALALALVVTGRGGGWGALGAEIWLLARIVYVPLYLVQIPFARSLAWFVSLLALIAMLIRLLS